MNANLKFRDQELSRRVAQKIQSVAANLQSVKICHVCGTHEWTITHFGIRSLLPANVEVIAGPGCPVCIVPAFEIDGAVQIARNDVTIACFGDVLRVPGSNMSLLDAKAEGADIRIVYSVEDAVKMARKEANRDFVFFAVGFETTAPSTAVEVSGNPPRNLSFLVTHRLIPPAMELLARMKDLELDGFLAPGHVSTIIGTKPYEVFPETYDMPTVIAGFEPLDVLVSVYLLMKQIREGRPRLENEYARVVQPEGNVRARDLMGKTFDVTDGNWRGLGSIPLSALTLKPKYHEWDALKKYSVKAESSVDIQHGCQCHLIIVGKIKPIQCPLFMKACTPQKPVGACMVGNEGTCRIWAGTLNKTA
jgi:hydrogenase expression/formation protein HypD